MLNGFDAANYDNMVAAFELHMFQTMENSEIRFDYRRSMDASPIVDIAPLVGFICCEPGRQSTLICPQNI